MMPSGAAAEEVKEPRQIELSSLGSSSKEDVVDHSLFADGLGVGLIRPPTNRGLFASPICCSDHRISEWEWLSIGGPLYKFVFGAEQSPIPDISFKHWIPHPYEVKMCGLEKRLQTFYGRWPKQMAQIPIEMAKAGFYFTGEGDKCMTFCCGLIVYQWNHYDDPLKEHKKHKPECFLPKLLEKSN